MTPVVPPSPPEAWAPARRAAARVIGPIERVLQVEASSGLILLVASAVALAWANSGWAASYEHLLHAPLGVTIGPWSVQQSVHFVINEVLMTIFFFVVGLEIRREIHGGELANFRRASLPIAAALGGMLVPAALYLAVFVALGPPAAAQKGWGVPMATDIAFAVGVLALLGKRVPPALRVLLLALAIIDDIGAIIVIAVFYSSSISLGGLALAFVGVLLVLVLQRFGVRRALAYVPAGVIIWVGLLKGGVHPTLSGVILGLLTPAAPWFGAHGFVSAAREAIDKVEKVEGRTTPRDSDLVAPLDALGQARREALAPAVSLQALLHPWVAFVIMPIFALANAGVVVNLGALESAAAGAVVAGVTLGLVVGKPLGVVLASFLAVRSGISSLPRGVGWRGVLLVGAVAGIGFTMAIFVAGLAFVDATLLAAAKLAVLVGSGAAAVLGLTFGRLALPPVAVPGALSATDAECSDDD